MKTLTLRLPDWLAAQIERESRARRMSKSEVVRERLRQSQTVQPGQRGTMREFLGDLIGSVEGLPSDLATNHKKYVSDVVRAKKLKSEVVRERSGDPKPTPGLGNMQELIGDILEQSWSAKVPARPRRFRSPKKQRLAKKIRARKSRH